MLNLNLQVTTRVKIRHGLNNELISQERIEAEGR